jgi:hypothetical protein
MLQGLSDNNGVDIRVNPRVYLLAPQVIVLPPVPGCLTFTFHLEPAPGHTTEMECYDYVAPPLAGPCIPASGSTGSAAAAAFPSVRILERLC